MNTAQPPASAAVAFCLLLSLAGCGGGGGGDRAALPAPNQAPVARVSASTDDGFAPLRVQFDASASSDADGTIAAYQWTFGDGTSASGAAVAHTFTTLGPFTVSLRVTDDQGASDTATTTLRVRGASVSGTIQIAPGSSVDSDVNDRFTTPVSNDTFGNAQPVANPLQLGGFANVPGSGSPSGSPNGSPDGNFTTVGDPADTFAVDLDGNERIVLSIGDPSADLDLELYNDDPEPVLIDASVSPDPRNDPTEDLVAPAVPGRYFVRVVAVEGASNYVLRIDDDIAPASLPRRAKRLSDPFVPNEVLMAENRRSPVRRFGLRRGHGSRGMRLTLLDRSNPAEPEVRLPEPALPLDAAVPALLAARYRTLVAIRHLNRRDRAALAEVNALRQPQRVPDDPLYDRQWHYRAIDLERAWNVTTGDRDVIVAVVDTGVLLDHPDLRNRLLRTADGRVVGYDFVQDPQRSNDGDSIDPNPNDPGDEERGPGQGSFHGTHVAGTIGAESNNTLGVAGVSWRSRLMPVRALGIDGGTTFDVMQAIRYAAGLNNVSGTVPPVRADIINLSLGSDFYSEAEQQTLTEVRSRGIFVVASAGNYGTSVPSYPAAYDGVISVAATNAIDATTYYSNFGSTIDIAAPGGQASSDDNRDGLPDGVASTIGSGGGSATEFAYGFLQGTSMAAPHVAGVIALMKAVHPDLTPGEFDALLQSGRLTRDLGPPGRDNRFGWGLIDAYQAVLAAQQASGDEFGPLVTASVGTLDFQAFTSQLDFAVNNASGADVAISVTTDAPWLAVEALDIDSNGFGQYRARVDRSGLNPGTYRATITVDSTGTELFEAIRIGVAVTVTGPDPSADAGQHYVVLTSPTQDESLAVEIVNAHNGEYTFTLEDVPPGEYRLFAGTDLDDDDVICDGGEACGAFPSLAGPEIIHIAPAEQPQVSGLTFASEFRTTASTTWSDADTAHGAGEGDDTGRGIVTAKPAEQEPRHRPRGPQR